jgi:hypothetical protein
VEVSIVERLDASRFDQSEDGRPILSGTLVYIQDEEVIYRQDPETGKFVPFAQNPWPLPTSNATGNFRFTDEARFPRHEIERDAAGRPVLDENGLQVWKPRDIRLGMNTAFEAANTTKDAAESWSGRALAWGDNGRLAINTHAFIAFNAFHSPTTRQLYFGVVPYRLPGEPPDISNIKMFEMATSWEVAAHEAGHALHDELKPHRDPSNQGFRTWSESFSDQLEMWTALRDPQRVRTLLAETNGDLNQSNALTRIGEALGALTGKEGTGLRDAFHDKKVSDTSDEIHDRSEVLTGAAYTLFLTVYSGLKSEPEAEAPQALRQAGRIMGTLLTRAADFTPENQMTLEDVVKAYLKVDKEFYDGRYHALLVDEFTRRELFDADSLSEWLAHEAALPDLCLRRGASEQEVEDLIRANLDQLGIGPDFGLTLQSVTRDHRFGQTIVRVQLTSGRGQGAEPLDNHGILTFRRDGTLADYHAPLPPDASLQGLALIAQAEQLRSLMARAAGLHLDQHGAALAVVRRPEGPLTVEVRVIRGEGLNAYMEVFTLENPQGERREIVIPPVPPDKRLPIPEDLLK